MLLPIARPVSCKRSASIKKMDPMLSHQAQSGKTIRDKQVAFGGVQGLGADPSPTHSNPLRKPISQLTAAMKRPGCGEIMTFLLARWIFELFLLEGLREYGFDDKSMTLKWRFA